MKRICILMFLLIGIVTGRAYDFKVDGFYYNIVSISDRTVEVTHSNNGRYAKPTYNPGTLPSYTGDIVIPSSVEFQGRTFRVIGIGEEAFAYSTIMSIKFPPTVKYIESGAFFRMEFYYPIVIPKTIDIVLDFPTSNHKITIEESDKPLLCYRKRGNGKYGFCNGLGVDSVYVGRTIVGAPSSYPVRYLQFGDVTSVITFGKYVSARCIYDHIEKSLEDREFFTYPEGEDVEKYRPVPITIVLEHNVPPVMPKEFHKNRYLKVKVRVPKAALSKYQAAPVWCNFFDLQGY